MTVGICIDGNEVVRLAFTEEQNVTIIVAGDCIVVLTPPTAAPVTPGAVTVNWRVTR